MGPVVSRFEVDEQDREIIARRMDAFDERPGVRVGDFVSFADGETARVAHIWTDMDGPDLIQTTYGDGSFHLGDEGVSHSGGLRPGVPADTLASTGMAKPGVLWVFHHDHRGGGRGVDSFAPFRAFSCSLASDGAPVAAAGVSLRIDNAYSDGHESSREITIHAPGDDVEAWWDNDVWNETGDGHGTERGITSCYTATVLASSDPRVPVGAEREWV